MEVFVALFRSAGNLMAVIDSAEFDGVLRGLSQRHACAAAFAENAFSAEFVIFRLATQNFCGDLLQLYFLRPSPRRTRRASLREWFGCRR